MGTEDGPVASPYPWDSGLAYEAYMGRWSRLVAGHFLPWLEIPVGNWWLDVGCGTGALSQTILETMQPGYVLGVDYSEKYIAFAQKQITNVQMRFRFGDAGSLPAETGDYDAVVSGLALNFLPDPGQALAEMIRAARLGGTLGAYVWDYAGRMQFLRHFWNAAAALDPAARELDEGLCFPMCQPEALKQMFETAGLKTVQVVAIDIFTDFRGFEDYWSPFLTGQAPAPGYVRSLSETGRAALRERLQASLPYALDGSIPLAARAWAVKGTC